jgi:hypothetical protein
MHNDTITRLCSELNKLENRSHALLNAWPIGLRGLDDTKDLERVRLRSEIISLKTKIESLRAIEAKHDNVDR